MNVKRGSKFSVVITDEEYTKMLENFDNMKIDIDYPTLDTLEKLEADMRKEPNKWIPYLIYLAETKKEVMTSEDKVCKKNLMNYLANILEIQDEE